MNTHEEHHYGYNSNQRDFDRQGSLIWKGIKLVFQLMVYAPLLLAGYIITVKILDKKLATTLYGLGLTLFFALLLYLLIIGLKILLLYLKSVGNLIWVAVFIICVCFTCLLSVYIIFEPLSQLIAAIHKGGSAAATWLIAVLFGLYVYRRYDFLDRKNKFTR